MSKKQSVLITGSSRGIGAAVARHAHAMGYKVILHGKNNSKELRVLASELFDSTMITFDVSNQKEVNQKIKELISEHGTIDILINNAGVALNRMTDLFSMNTELALKEYKVNVLGSLYCTEAVIQSMKSQGKGSIVNIGSIKGHPNLTTMSTLTYGATKAGIIAITKALAKEYTPFGIRINIVSPGYVKTDQVKNWDKKTFDRINNGTLIARMAQPDEIAKTILFIASDESSYTTGSEILIDGGYELKGK